MNTFTKRLRIVLLGLLGGFWGAATAQAAIEVDLFNHPDGNASSGGFYGLRLDYPGAVPSTFSFESTPSTAPNFANDSNVTLKIFPGPSGSGGGFGSGLIEGSVIHNQSNQLWTISAKLEMHTLNKDGDAVPWYVNSADVTAPINLYDDVLADLKEHGSTPSGDLKSDSDLDKIVFDIVELTMEYVDPIGGTPDFNPPGLSGATVLYYDFPDGSLPGNDPFVISKGHRLPEGNFAADELVGVGWLGDAETDPARQKTQDFLFVLGEPRMIPDPPIDPSGDPVPEPISLVVWGGLSLLLMGCIGNVRRRD